MSIRVFRKFLTVNPDNTVDASQIISRECFLAFLLAKGAEESELEARKFHRVLTTHLSGVDGRRPFNLEEERAILHVLRNNRPWPCFLPESHLVMGFRGKGYHEKQEYARIAASSSSSSPSPPSSLLPQPSTHPELEAEAKFILQMSKHFGHFAVSFAKFELEVLHSIVCTLRFLLLAKIPKLFALKRDDEEYATAFCGQPEFFNSYAMVWDIVHPDFILHPIACNHTCALNKTDVLSVAPDQVLNWVNAIALCCFHPGHRFTAKQDFCWKDVKREVTVTYVQDPLSSFFLGFWNPSD